MRGPAHWFERNSLHHGLVDAGGDFHLQPADHLGRITLEMSMCLSSKGTSDTLYGAPFTLVSLWWREDG
jgi:hypothetical protein